MSAQFLRYRLGRDIEGIRLDADRRFFDRLLPLRGRASARYRQRGLGSTRQGPTDSGGWSRCSALRCRLGAAELLYQTDVPPRVAIREYTDLVGDFFDEPQARFATAVFDRIAHSARPGELDGPAA